MKNMNMLIKLIIKQNPLPLCIYGQNYKKPPWAWKYDSKFNTGGG